MMEQIHKFKIFDKMFALDVEGCFVFEVDEITWEVLEYFGIIDPRQIVNILAERFTSSQLEEVIQELEILKNQGFILKGNAGQEESAEESYLESISLYLMKDSQTMSEATAEKAIDFLIMKSGGGKKVKVEFIVPQSLLNSDIIEHAYDYAGIQGKVFNKDFQFCLTITRIPFSDAGQVDIVLDFGKIKDIKGILKYLASAKKEGEEQLSKIRKYVSALEKKNLTSRVNFFPSKADFPGPIKSLIDSGFTSIYLGCDQSLSSIYLSLQEEVDLLKEKYEITGQDYLDRLEKDSAIAIHPFKSVLAQVYDGSKKYIRRCQAGKQSLAISTQGDIYPCSQFLVVEKCRIGNINNHDYDLTREAEFSALSINEKEGCPDCWAKYFCGGGCPALAYLFEGKITRPHPEECNLTKHVIKLGVMTNARLEEKGNLLPQIGNGREQTFLSLSLNDERINVRLLEKNDLEAVVRWRDDSDHSYFLTENMGMGLARGKQGEVVDTSSKVELILENNNRAPLCLFRVCLAPPFRKGEISFFTPDKDRLNNNEFIQMGLSLLHNLFKKWNLPGIYSALLETETEYIEYLKRFGFRAEGLLREQIFHHGKYHNLLAMRLMKGELKRKWWK